MNRLIALLPFVCLILAGCGKDKPTPPEPTPPPADKIELTGAAASGKIVIGSEGGAADITFTSSGTWVITVPGAASSWCSVNVDTGSSKDGKVTVTATPNESYDERNASLTLTCGKATQTVVVTQKQLDALLVSSSKVEVAPAGDDFTINVKANVDVKYDIPAQYSWLRAATGSRGLSSTHFKFTAAANDTGEGRQGEIIFSGAGKQETVNVYQPTLDGIILSKTTKFISSEGGRFDVELKSSVPFTYSIADGCDWLREDASRAMSSHTIYFIADAYEGASTSRSATITFTPTVGGLPPAVLTVVQSEPGALVVGTPKIDATCAGGTYEIEYASNLDVRVSVPSWCTVVQSRDVESHSVRVEIKANLSKKERSGEIVLTSTSDTPARATVAVTQEALRYTVERSFNDGDFMDARSHDITVKVDSPLDFELDASAPLEEIDEGHYTLPANYTAHYLGQTSIALKFNGTLIESLPIFFAAPITPEIENAEIRSGAPAGKVEVAIRTNTDIYCTITSGAQWLTINKINTHNGNTTDTWVFDVSENTGSSERQARVHFSAGNFWSADVTIVQEAKTIVEGSSTTVEIPTGGSLKESLGGNELAIGDLTVAGEMGADDMATLRRMATEGVLTQLDLSKSVIKKDLSTTYAQGFEPPARTVEDDMIGYWLFYESNIREIKMPENLKRIGYNAFSESKIEKAEIPQGVITIDSEAFWKCSELRTVTLPSSLEKVAKYTFYGCCKLENINLPEGLREINEFAFAADMAYTTNTQLRSITIPSTVEKLGRRCFMSTKLAEVTVPASVITIDDGVFMECRNLSRISFECPMDTLPAWILYNVRYLESIDFPPGLKVIGERALDHAGLKRLVIPEGVTTLMAHALNGSGQASLKLPESLEVIGAYALGYQSLVSSFTIPKNVREIGVRAFDGACYFTELHMKCPQPPKRHGDIFFTSFKYENCTLYVPAGSKAAYQADEYWRKFKDIVEE